MTGLSIVPTWFTYSDVILRHGGADSGRDPTHEPVGTASLDIELPPTCLVDHTGTDVAALARVQRHASGAVRLLPRRAQTPVTDVALQTPRVGQQTEPEKHINDGQKADERLNHKSHPRWQEHARPAANNNGGSWQAGDSGAAVSVEQSQLVPRRQLLQTNRIYTRRNCKSRFSEMTPLSHLTLFANMRTASEPFVL